MWSSTVVSIYHISVLFKLMLMQQLFITFTHDHDDKCHRSVNEIRMGDGMTLLGPNSFRGWDMDEQLHALYMLVWLRWVSIIGWSFSPKTRAMVNASSQVDSQENLSYQQRDNPFRKNRLIYSRNLITLVIQFELYKVLIAFAHNSYRKMMCVCSSRPLELHFPRSWDWSQQDVAPLADQNGDCKFHVKY